MMSGHSVSGVYFSHPESKYFAVGHLVRDQVKHCAARSQRLVAEVEKRLAPDLGYEA